MNKRLWFLSGHLSGLLVGAALAWSFVSNTAAEHPVGSTIPPNPVVVPVSEPVRPHVPQAGQLPDDWKLRYFNGQPYYLIPLSESDPSTI